MSFIKTGVHIKALNPITSAKIIQTVDGLVGKGLYGCELWELTQTDKQMLERTHRFNAKSIQGFSRQTRTDICLGLLGWTSIESLIDIKKLQFLARANV